MQLNVPSILLCPLCQTNLKFYEKYYACVNNHCFDIAKTGYLNLLLVNQKKTRQPGDSKEMAKARLVFLHKGYYQPIADALVDCCKNLLSKNHPQQLLDIGCGVGYYLDRLRQALNPLPANWQFWGIDISKEAIHLASIQQKENNYLVGSAKRLPFETASQNIITSIFAPCYHDELLRVLSEGGHFISITPNASHLIELRKIIFSSLKEIDSTKIINKFQDKLTLLKSINIEFTILLTNPSDINELLLMTPFYWHCAHRTLEELKTLTELSLTISVTLNVFKKYST